MAPIESPQAAVEQAHLALLGRIRRNRLMALAALLLLATAMYFAVRGTTRPRHALQMTAGDPLGHRHQLAVVLSAEAASHKLDIDLDPSEGTLESLRKVAAGEFDVAFVQGDVTIDDARIRQVAILMDEPLHLFVKADLLAGGPSGLRGKRLSLNAVDSDTRKMATQLLSFIGFEGGRDFVDEAHTYEELLELPADKLPDGVFGVTTLPWTEMSSWFIDHNYRLMELPFGDAMSLRDQLLHDAVIPAFAYGASPPVPDRPIHTVSGRLMLVANEHVPAAAITRLLEVVFDSDFELHAEIPPLDPNRIDLVRQYPLHPGALKFLHRNDPLFTGQLIDALENLRSFLMSAALAAFLLWRYARRRRMIGFETYLDAVTAIELEALDAERRDQLAPERLHELRRRLTEIKTEALEKNAEGQLTGEEQMVSFLAHVADVRSYLESLFAHESRQQATAAEEDKSSAASTATLRSAASTDGDSAATAAAGQPPVVRES